jgi:flagellar motor switch protein FliG
MRVRETYRTLTGPEKAAILMLSIGEDYASRLFVLMDDEEIKSVSQTMASLGTVSAAVIERLFAEFADQVAPASALPGSTESSQGLLESVLGKDGGDKVSVSNEQSLLSSLKAESPETAANVLARIKPEQTAQILGQLPEDFAQEVVMRMLRETSAQAAAGGVKPTPDSDFISSLGRAAEGRAAPALDARSRAAAERFQAAAFGFEDLGRIGPVGVQTLLRHADKAKLALALKGASEPLRGLFYANMSERSRRTLREEILALGPVKLRDVDEAQMYMVGLAKELGAKDEIALAGAPRGNDELIY